MAETLKKYNQKRNFKKTAEPKGTLVKSKQKLHYVVQHHMARREHYDFRLEWEGALLSWAVPKGPSYCPRDKRLAVKVEDHPLNYRNFEGTIPKGEYGGGTVMLWDEGYWEPEIDISDGLAQGSLKFTLKGKRLKGKWALIQMKKDGKPNADNWLLLKEKDEYEQTSAGISDFLTSIRSGRTMAEIETNQATKKAAKSTASKQGSDKASKNRSKKNIKNPFQDTEVQLAKLEQDFPEGGEWLYEMKYDGYRIMAYLEEDKVRLMTRNGYDYADRFASVADTLVDWAAGQSMVLDGEMVIVDEQGKTDFQALQNYLRNPVSQHLKYIVFDLLAFNGMDYREMPLVERKNKLDQLMKNPPKNLQYSNHILGKGEECFAAACQNGMEGIVGKRANAPYQGAKNGDWIKLKCDNRQEFVIGGYTLTDKKTTGVSSLLLGVYEADKLVYVGRAGTGLGQEDVEFLEQKWKGLKRKQSPFQNEPKQRNNETITWLRPKLIAEIKFAEWTNENLLRQASFKGLRIDKKALDIVRESSS